MAPPDGDLTLTVNESESNQRLDTFLKKRGGLSTREVSALISEGCVQIDGRRGKKGDRLFSGAQVRLPAPAPKLVVPQVELELSVLADTAHFLVLNKPAGQPSHVLERGELDTLSNAAVARYPELQGIGHGWREPGLIHRLDTFTSGVVIVAKTQGAFTCLSRALKAGQLEKRYLAVIDADGVPSSLPLEINQALESDPRDPRRVTPASSGPQVTSRITRLVERHQRWALIEVEAHRAYRHQIRAHLASIDCPLVGDVLYGGYPEPSLKRNDDWRHALHASYAAWAGDDEFEGFSVRCDLPGDLRELLDGPPT